MFPPPPPHSSSFQKKRFAFFPHFPTETHSFLISLRSSGEKTPVGLPVVWQPSPPMYPGDDEAGPGFSIAVPEARPYLPEGCGEEEGGRGAEVWSRILACAATEGHFWNFFYFKKI